MQKLKLACLLLITSSALVASDTAGGNKKSPTLSGRSCNDLVATAALNQSPKNRDLPTLTASAKTRSTEHGSRLAEPKTPGRPYHLTALERDLIIPTVHDRPQAPATPYSDANLRKPGTWYLVEDSSCNDEQWCPHHDRSETCYRCIWPSYRCGY